MLVMLSSIGVPGLNGFVGEFLILIGSFLTARWWTVVAAVGVILAALYLLWAYQRVFHGEPDEDNKHVPRAHAARKALVLLPFLGLIVFIGVYPKPMLDRIEPSVDALITHVEEHTDYVEPEPTVEIGEHGCPRTGRAHGDEPPSDEGETADARTSSTPSSAPRSAGSRCRRCSSLLGGDLACSCSPVR